MRLKNIGISIHQTRQTLNFCVRRMNIVDGNPMDIKMHAYILYASVYIKMSSKFFSFSNISKFSSIYIDSRGVRVASRNTKEG